jgi:hypothetical protein
MASHHALRPLGLEAFSHAFAKRVLESHSAWLPFVVPAETEEDGLTVRTFAAHLPSPNPRVVEPLTISVNLDGIVTVSWMPRGESSLWHVDWVLASPDDAADEVSRFVEAFIKEEMTAFWTDDGPGEGGMFGTVSAQEVLAGTFRRGKAKTEIRSWRGSLDQSL